MQTLSDLAKSIQQKTSEQAKTTEQIVSSEFQQLEQNLQQKLNESEILISNAIASHEKNLKMQINKVLAYKTIMGSVMGFLVAMLAILTLANLYFYKKLDTAQTQLAEIQQNIKQSPLEAQILAKVTTGKNDDGTLWIEAKQTKAKVGKSMDGKPLMMLE
ncbi:MULTISPECIES: MbeB family mobilization protein [Pseudomonadota]|uniref:MbeB family mobilization protein n=1 Tax=Pseudomonadota TaxID=1224 RepID=UPI0015C77838